MTKTEARVALEAHGYVARYPSAAFPNHANGVLVAKRGAPTVLSLSYNPDVLDLVLEVGSADVWKQSGGLFVQWHLPGLRPIGTPYHYHHDGYLPSEYFLEFLLLMKKAFHDITGS